MKDHVVIAPNSFVHGPWSQRECIRVAKSWSEGPYIIAKLTPTHRIDKVPVVEQLP
jgi:hypothetical protein